MNGFFYYLDQVYNRIKGIICELCQTVQCYIITV